MCLEYLQRTIWREDFILAALVLRVLEPCLQGSDQVKTSVTVVLLCLLNSTVLFL